MLSEEKNKNLILSRRKLALVGVAAAAGGTGTWFAATQSAVDGPPQIPPSVSVETNPVAALFNGELPSPTGQTLNLASLRGKPLLVNFWATWCPPCVEELPLLERFYQQQRSKSWNVLAIAADSEKNVQGFLQRMPLTFTVAIAGASAIDWSRRLGNLSGGLPFTVVVNSAGEVAQRKLGQVHEADLLVWQGIS